MRLVMMALFDVKVGQFMTPFFSQSVGGAIRSLADLVNKAQPEEGDLPALHPEDFRLFRLGVWDGESGLVSVEAQPQLVSECANLKVTR